MRYFQSESNFNKPLVIAHRGASGLAPENTLAAFRLAISQGAQGIEFDVQLSADDQPVVIHDTRLNRTTDVRGFVNNFTAKEFSHFDAGSWFERRLSLRPRTRIAVERERARAGSKTFAGETVPTLEDALNLIAPAALARIYIELKSKPSSRKPLAEAVLSLVHKFKLERSATILSFDHEAIRLVKESNSPVRTAATFSVSGRALLTPRSIIKAVEHASADEAALHFGLATRRMVAALKERGLGISVWTVNRRIIMHRLIARGVDAIMTNFPHRLIEVIESPDNRLPGKNSQANGNQ